MLWLEEAEVAVIVHPAPGVPNAFDRLILAAVEDSGKAFDMRALRLPCSLRHEMLEVKSAMLGHEKGGNASRRLVRPRHQFPAAIGPNEHAEVVEILLAVRRLHCHDAGNDRARASRERDRSDCGRPRGAGGDRLNVLLPIDDDATDAAERKRRRQQIFEVRFVTPSLGVANLDVHSFEHFAVGAH